MQRRTLLVLAVLFVGLLAYVLVVEVGREEQREAQKDREEQVLPIDADGVTGLVVTGDRGAVSLERRGEGLDGEWFIVDPYEAPADPAAAQGLARAAATLQEQRLLEQPSEDLSQYGLDDPVLRVTVEAEGLEGAVELIFGGETATGDGRYVRIDGEPGLRIAPAHQFRSLNKGVDDLRDRRLVRFSPGSATRVTLSGEAGRVLLVRDSGPWRIGGELPYRAARAEVDNLLAELTTTRVKRFMDADDPTLGLLDTSTWVEVELDDDTSVGIDFGREEGDTVVAQVRGAEEAAELSSFVLRSLEWTAADWRSREIADINPWEVSELRFTYRERSFELLEDDEGEWTLSEGEGKPRAIEAPWARELLAALDRCQVEDFFDPGSDPGPEVGSFEIVTEGQPQVRFTLHEGGATWVAEVEGDPAPAGISADLSVSLDAFLEDPMGEAAKE